MPLHPSVDKFIRRALRDSGSQVRGSRVVEFGSLTMHDHDPRPLFAGYAEYVGVDQQPGRGVDVVSLAHEFDGDGFDFALSLQALEHDPYWEQTLRAMVRAIRPDGLVIVTCAGPDWQPHELDCSPEPGYYRNIDAGEMLTGLRGACAEIGCELQATEWTYDETVRPWKRTCVWAKVAAL